MADVIIYLGALGFVALWIGTIVYAFRKRQELSGLVLALCVFGGVFGFLVAFLMLNTKVEPPRLGEAGVESCPHCRTPYRPSDYREDAAILCSDCRQEIRGLPASG